MRVVPLILAIGTLQALVPELVAQPRAAQVPAEAVVAGKLQPPGLGFSLEPPGASWKWMRMEGSHEINFQAVEEASGRVFTITVHSGQPLNSEVANGFVAGVKEGDPARGIGARDVVILESSIPRPASYRYSYTQTSPAGEIYWTGYLVALPKTSLIVIAEMRDAPGESAEFASFVKSLKLLPIR